MHQPLIFLDTDIGPDCDDTAALAILLQLCREGQAELLGITHCTGSPYGLAAVDAICRLFDVQVPLGTCKDDAFLASGPALCYTPAIAGRFEHGYPPDAPQPAAVSAFRAALSKAQHPVTLVGIGPLNNIAAYLSDPAAAEQMEEKVERLVLMAGRFEGSQPEAEWNVASDISAARTVLDRWHKEISFCPFEAASAVLIGACLRNYPENPVSMAYRLFTKGSMLRPSWDPATVLSAVNGTQAPYAWSDAGEVSIDGHGVSHFKKAPGGKHRYLRLVGSAQEAALLLEKQLIHASQTMTKHIEAKQRQAQADYPRSAQL